MGGSPKKRESNGERNARMLAAQKSGLDAAALQDSAMRLKNARRRAPLFGGPETGSTLGGAATPLGIGA